MVGTIVSKDGTNVIELLVKTSLEFHDVASSLAERRDLRSPRVEVTVAVSRLGDVELTHLAPAVSYNAGLL